MLEGVEVTIVYEIGPFLVICPLCVAFKCSSPDPFPLQIEGIRKGAGSARLAQVYGNTKMIIV